MRGKRGGRAREVVALAVCVFNFPGPFCMQISSVIYPGVERKVGGGVVGKERRDGGCTCGG